MTAHLSETAASTLTLSDRDRVQHIRKPRWIGYGRAKEILCKLEDLLIHPRQARMPNMLLVGETTRFAERYSWFAPGRIEHHEDAPAGSRARRPGPPARHQRNHPALRPALCLAEH